jgi:hypothetical protein
LQPSISGMLMAAIIAFMNCSFASSSRPGVAEQFHTCSINDFFKPIEKSFGPALCMGIGVGQSLASPRAKMLAT